MTLPNFLITEYSEKNSKPVETLTSGSSYRALWVCAKGHEWEAPVYARKNFGCPVCAGKKLQKGFNDFLTLKPYLASQWHYALNGNMKPEQFFSTSSQKVWWVCEEKHEWEAKISSRVKKNSGCRTCSRNTGTIEKNVFTIFPDIIIYASSPEMVEILKRTPPKSGEVLQWICPVCVNSWEMSVYKMVSRISKCHFCHAQRTKNSQQEIYSKRKNVYWHSMLNDTVKPSFPLLAGQEFWWTCNKNHEWVDSFQNVFYKNRKCPVCKKVYLPASHPDLTKQWGDQNLITPENITAGSGLKVWWRCERNHEWEAAIYSRAGKSQAGCPICNTSRGSSLMEQEVLKLIVKLLPHMEVEENIKTVLPNGKELDIYIPAHNIAIEFNGVYWHDENHKPKNYHYDKWLACKDKGIQLIQIWEDDWVKNPEQVMNMLASQLGVSSSELVNADNAELVNVSPYDLNQFFEENNHSQPDFEELNIQAGLGLANKLISVMVGELQPVKGKRALTLSYYCSSTPVWGGFRRLLTHVETILSPEVITIFNNNSTPNRGMFLENGFREVEVLPPDHMYVVKNVRKSRNDYGIVRFKTDPALVFREGLTEHELADLNNIPRIWDAGKTKWVKVLD